MKKTMRRMKMKTGMMMLGLGASVVLASACGGSGDSGSGLDESLVVSELTAEQSEVLYKGVRGTVDDYAAASHGLMCNMAGLVPVFDELTQGNSFSDLFKPGEDLEALSAIREKDTCETARDACLDKDLETILTNMAKSFEGLDVPGVDLEADEASDEFIALQKSCEGVNVGEFEACFAEMTGSISKMADATTCGTDIKDIEAFTKTVGEAQDGIIGADGKDSVCAEIRSQCAIDDVIGGSAGFDDFASGGFSSGASDTATSGISSPFGPGGFSSIGASDFFDDVDGGNGSIPPVVTGGNSDDPKNCEDEYDSSNTTLLQSSIAQWVFGLNLEEYPDFDTNDIEQSTEFVANGLADGCEVTDQFKADVKDAIVALESTDGFSSDDPGAVSGPSVELEPCKESDVDGQINSLLFWMDATGDSFGENDIVSNSTYIEQFLADICVVTDETQALVREKVTALSTREPDES